MSDFEQRLKASWDSIRRFDTGSVQLPVEHPLDWFVAYETATNKALVAVSKYPIEEFEPSRCIGTACRPRGDNTYYISFQLIDNSQEEVFINMCSNIIEYSSNALSEKDAIKRVAVRYKQWRKLMEHRNIAMLSDEKRRGLIGELLYLKKMIIEGKSPADALSGWIGPDGADQDFIYDSLWREIKTTGVSSDNISISSIEQLGTGDEQGELIIFRVDPTAPEQDGVFTIRSLVNSVSDLFEGDSELVDLFVEKLNSVGYIDLDVYDKYPYKFTKMDCYSIDESFPRLFREDVRPEIVKCVYTLSISSIDSWRRE